MKVEEIQSKCLDSEGYLVFAAYLTPKRDKDDHAIIDFQYWRYHFGLEDSKQALKTLRGFIDAEIEKLAQPEGDEG